MFDLPTRRSTRQTSHHTSHREGLRLTLALFVAVAIVYPILACMVYRAHSRGVATSPQSSLTCPPPGELTLIQQQTRAFTHEVAS
jgi:tellurite resistance protein TehA-like permease